MKSPSFDADAHEGVEDMQMAPGSSCRKTVLSSGHEHVYQQEENPLDCKIQSIGRYPALAARGRI